MLIKIRACVVCGAPVYADTTMLVPLSSTAQFTCNCQPNKHYTTYPDNSDYDFSKDKNDPPPLDQLFDNFEENDLTDLVSNKTLLKRIRKLENLVESLQKMVLKMTRESDKMNKIKKIMQD